MNRKIVFKDGNGEVVGTRFSKKCIIEVCKQICENKYFTTTINLSIVLNTLVLAMDSYPIDMDLSKRLDAVNIMFFSVFFSEMVIKIVGLGPKIYILDRYNIFDAIIGKF